MREFKVVLHSIVIRLVHDCEVVFDAGLLDSALLLDLPLNSQPLVVAYIECNSWMRNLRIWPFVCFWSVWLIRLVLRLVRRLIRRLIRIVPWTRLVRTRTRSWTSTHAKLLASLLYSPKMGDSVCRVYVRADL